MSAGLLNRSFHRVSLAAVLIFVEKERVMFYRGGGDGSIGRKDSRPGAF